MTFGALLYFATLAVWSAVISYLLLFTVLPSLPFLGGKGKKKHVTHHAPVHHAPVHHAPTHHTSHRTRFSAHEGFKSFAEGVELTVEDIVKGMSRE